MQEGREKNGGEQRHKVLYSARDGRTSGATRSKQGEPSLFDGFKSMTLMDCLRESGRLRREMYWKQLAHERRNGVTELVQIADEIKDDAA